MFKHREQIAQGLVLFILAMLPWQTVWLYRSFVLPTGTTIYGQMGVYAVEGLIALCVLLRGRPLFPVAAIPVIQAVFVGLAACALSVGWSHGVGVALGFASHILAAVLLFFLLVDARMDGARAWRWFCLGLVPAVGVGWWQVIVGHNPDVTLLGLSAREAQTSGVAVVATQGMRLLRAYGSFPHPNVFGGYLIMALLFLGRRYVEEKERWRMMDWVWVGLFASTLVLTFSRSAWVGGLVAAMTAFGYARNKKSPMSQSVVRFGAVVGSCAVVVALCLSPFFLARFNTQLPTEARSVNERAHQLAIVPLLFPHYPLFGVGPGVSVFAEAVYAPGRPAWDYQPIHNVPLLLLVEVGVVGVAAWGYALFRLIQTVMRHGPFDRRMFGLAAVICLLVIANLDHYLWTLWPGLALVACAAAWMLKPSESVDRNVGES